MGARRLFLLRQRPHLRIYDSRQHWTMPHRRWLAGQSFTHSAQQSVFQRAIGKHGRATASNPGNLGSKKQKTCRDSHVH